MKPILEIKGVVIEVVRDDLTVLNVDAVVNAANNKLVMGGGLAAALKRKGGASIEEEAMKKGPIAVGQAVATKAGNLSCRYVIHAATMGMDFKTDENKIRLSCRNALTVAAGLQCQSVGLPALGCGTGGFPYLASAKVMAQEVLRFIRETKNNPVKKIVFCLFDPEACEIFQKGVCGYLRHVTEELYGGPFVTVDAIIEMGADSIIIIERSNPPFGFALPGGFVDYGESLEDAVCRETREETGMELVAIKQFHTYSDPRRDPRFHTIGTVYIGHGKGTPKAGDDAAGLRVIKLSEVEKLPFAFDHKTIIQDYIRSRK